MLVKQVTDAVLADLALPEAQPLLGLRDEETLAGEAASIETGLKESSTRR